MPTREAADLAWLRAAIVVGGTLSKEPRRPVGACVVSASGRQSSFGYAGLPAGMPDSDKNWERPGKYERVVHAEVNALLNAPFDCRGSTLYCPIKPCHRCLGQAVNAGCARAVWFARREGEGAHRAAALENEEVFAETAVLIETAELAWDLASLRLYEVDWRKSNAPG